MSPRPKKIRKVVNPPIMKGFKPYGIENKIERTDPVFLLYEEYEALRLCDFELHNHTEAAILMDVSRPTFTRIYATALRKIADAFVNAKQIVIEGGKIYFDSDWFHCKSCGCYFNNPFKDKTIENCSLCKSLDIKNYNEGFENGNTSFNQCCEVCVCPNCGYEREHQQGEPCRKMICPQCNVHLIRKT